MTGGTRQLAQYYQKRAQDYEQIYQRQDPGRQLEQLELALAVGQNCLDRTVLELACGTGYWTQYADRVAASVVAVDAAQAVLDIAAEKGLHRTHFMTGDAYAPPKRPGGYTAALACFWISHVPRQRLSSFLDGLHGCLADGARVLLADNQFIEGLGGSLTGPDAAGDTYKRRTLTDGSEHLVLKNYLTPTELEGLLRGRATELKIHTGHCFWWASYTVRGEG